MDGEEVITESPGVRWPNALGRVLRTGLMVGHSDRYSVVPADQEQVRDTHEPQGEGEREQRIDDAPAAFPVRLVCPDSRIKEECQQRDVGADLDRVHHDLR